MFNLFFFLVRILLGKGIPSAPDGAETKMQLHFTSLASLDFGPMYITFNQSPSQRLARTPCTQSLLSLDGGGGTEPDGLRA